jgi:hypothetical protein
MGLEKRDVGQEEGGWVGWEEIEWIWGSEHLNVRALAWLCQYLEASLSCLVGLPPISVLAH